MNLETLLHSRLMHIWTEIEKAEYNPWPEAIALPENRIEGFSVSRGHFLDLIYTSDRRRLLGLRVGSGYFKLTQNPRQRTVLLSLIGSPEWKARVKEIYTGRYGDDRILEALHQPKGTLLHESNGDEFTYLGLGGYVVTEAQHEQILSLGVTGQRSLWYEAYYEHKSTPRVYPFEIEVSKELSVKFNFRSPYGRPGYHDPENLERDLGRKRAANDIFIAIRRILKGGDHVPESE